MFVLVLQWSEFIKKVLLNWNIFFSFTYVQYVVYGEDLVDEVN